LGLTFENGDREGGLGIIVVFPVTAVFGSLEIHEKGLYPLDRIRSQRLPDVRVGCKLELGV
jgi:hypothetical protein